MADLELQGGRALTAVLGSAWAITEDALQTIIEVASRRSLDPEAVAAKLGRPLENTRRVTVRDGVATIPITGPLFRYANLFTAVSGASSYEMIAKDFMAAIEDPQVQAILLDVDSPGGMVNGAQELAQLIYEMRGTKPIVAHVSGMGASGAYWLASAAEEITAGPTASLGSIGVKATWVDTRKADEMAGIEVIEIVSSQSPKKSPDPKKRDGRAQIQAFVDDLAAVMVSTVGRNRGVDEETVLADFGQGDVFVGQRAVDAGLADRLSTYEAVLAELAGRTSTTAAGSFTMADNEKKETAAAPAPSPLTAEQIATQYPDFVAAWRTEGADAERERILGIEAIAEAGHEELIERCKQGPSCSPETAAFKMRQADKAKQEAKLAALEGDEAALDKPDPNVGAEAEGETAQEVSRTLAVFYEAQGQASTAGAAGSADH